MTTRQRDLFREVFVTPNVAFGWEVARLVFRPRVVFAVVFPALAWFGLRGQGVTGRGAVVWAVVLGGAVWTFTLVATRRPAAVRRSGRPATHRAHPLHVAFGPRPHQQDAPPAPVDELHRVPIGLVDDGTPWTLRLWETHVLLGGITGSGKTRVIYSLFHSIAPWVRHGEVQLWGFDPKRVGLTIARPMFARLWTQTQDRTAKATWGVGAAQLLEDAVEVMEQRLEWMEDNGETEHVPSAADPLIVILVDEMAELTDRPDKAIKARIDDALKSLTREGRAAAVSVIICTQDPRKETLAYRDFIPTRIGLQLASSEQVTMVLGPGAREQGARCDEIIYPGQAYVRVVDLERGTSVLRLVRSTMVSNDEVKALAAEYPAPGAPPSLRVVS